MRKFCISLRLYSCISCCVVLVAVLAALFTAPGTYAQLSGTISGTVTDQSGAIVPNARVVLLNDASQERRSTVTNDSGYFSFVSVLPGTYTVTIEADNFKSWQQGNIVMHPGDVQSLSRIQLQVGSSTEKVMVEAALGIEPVDSGAREAVLTSREIDNIPLVSRNLSEMLKVLPGVTSTMNGTSNGAGFMNFLNTGVEGSAIGVGLDINGTAYRGGTGYTSDGANIIDPGCNCWAIALVNPDMTQEVQVQTSNFGADVQKGPVVVNTIGKSGTKEYHGQGYLYARNDVLNANDWVDNSLGNKRGSGHYYYPGGSFGGPVPFTAKKLFFWFGYEHFLQNTGTANPLKSFIPSPGMMSGNFTSSGSGNATLCPNLDANGNDTGATPQTGTACSSINGMILPDGSKVANGMIPAKFVSPGAAALASIWPAPNVTNAAQIQTLGGYNYFQTFPGIHNGYMLRGRVDYDLNDSNKFFVSFQYGTDSAASGGTGAHIYFTPGNAIPFPGGGVQGLEKSKLATGHFVHVFNPSATNEFIASWGWGYNPNTADLALVTKSKLGYSYGSVFKNPSVTMIPSYNSPANQGGSQLSIPDFSQPDLFESGSGAYVLKKQMPSFADNFTKVWRSQTIKMGFYYENTGNNQAGYNYGNGVFSFGGQNPDFFNSGIGPIGSAVNPTADFVAGIASNYQETNGDPYQDMAYRTIASYVDDSWKATKRLTVQFGLRFDHIGHWYDRAGTGMAAFFPDLVLVDEANLRPNPGVRYHGIDPGVPNGGSPSRFAFVSPRFGVAYDLFGTGKTVLRGGWGKYRWNDQVNDYEGALGTSQALKTYNLPGKTNVLLSEIGNLPAPVSGLSTPGSINGSIYATDPNDYEIPATYSYNFTISQALPWRTLFEIGYVGSDTEKILIGGQNGIGNLGKNGADSIIDRNKVPLGAFFAADPVTGLVAGDPENLNSTCTAGGVCNRERDYRPYSAEYGSNSVVVPEHIGYANYNALQMAWAKQGGRLTYNLNYTWSKALGTALNINPFSLAGNYGVLNIDRPHVINTSYAYNLPAYYHGESRFIKGAVSGWTIAGLTTWQAGANMQANYNADFAFTETYTNTPAIDPRTGKSFGTNAITGATYFGTSAGMNIMPVLTCDPRSGLASNQAARLACFAPPAFGSNGPRNFPYIKGPAYWNSDLSLSKLLHITERHTVEFRASATNWLNHPLLSFSSGNQLQLRYQRDFVTGAITSGLSPQAQNTWGTFDTKVGAPNQRIMELSVKYSF